MSLIVPQAVARETSDPVIVSCLQLSKASRGPRWTSTCCVETEGDDVSGVLAEGEVRRLHGDWPRLGPAAAERR